MKTNLMLGASALFVVTTLSTSNLAFAEKKPASDPIATLFNLKVDLTPPAGVIVVEPTKPAKPPEPPKPIEYVVVDGDNLTKIANANSTTWLRLWQKNTGLADPDEIKPGDKLVIPDPLEALADRPVPANAPIIAHISPLASVTSGAIPRGGSSGNTYTYGYCTWYVKNRRPDLPNNLGNAETWYSRAAAQGIPVGAAPRVGAVGQAGNHVVYVEAVNGDGTILISEMNYQGWNIQSSRTANASSFRYIY